eukprot:TRINITY_DN65815_c0_g1_i1.p1 TRINITY_DN65815_c0_g1~~TRINITY_DN65815_c0_g1_i1.p1  ORF type:complete len:835 (+),score=327.97 TRINITY_DN65815_c0_g1_i1:76-2505(+)
MPAPTAGEGRPGAGKSSGKVAAGARRAQAPAPASASTSATSQQDKALASCLAWLESAEITPNALMTHSIDVAGLCEVVTKLVTTVVITSKQQERVRQDCDRCMRAVEEARRVGLDAEVRRKAVDDMLAQLQSDMRIVQGDKLEGSEFERVRLEMQKQFKQLEGRCDQLQAQKLDATAPQLERDSRRHALETVKDYYSVQSRELRQWVERRLESLGAGLRKEDQHVLEKASAKVEEALQEMGERVANASAEIDMQLRSQAERVEDGEGRSQAMMQKLRDHERDADVQEAEALSESVAVRREIRSLMRALGVSVGDLAQDLPPSWDAEEEADVERRRTREEAAVAREKSRLQQWKTIHAVQPKAPYQPEAAAEWRRADEEMAQLLTQRSAEVEPNFAVALRDCRRRRDSRARDLQRDGDARKDLGGTASAWVSDAVVQRLLKLPVLIELRETVEESIAARVNKARDDVVDDLSQQILALGKDMKTKINATRCVELITDNTRRIGEGLRTANARLDEMQISKIGTDHCHDMLKEKADRDVLEKKMDRQTAVDMFEFLNSKIEELAQESEAATLVRQLGAGIDEVRQSKIDKDDPEWLTVLGMCRGGGFQTQQQGPSERPGSAPMPAMMARSARQPGDPHVGASPALLASVPRTVRPPGQRTPGSKGSAAPAVPSPVHANSPMLGMSAGAAAAPAPTVVSVEELVSRRAQTRLAQARSSESHDMRIAATQDVRRQREQRTLGDAQHMDEIQRLLGDMGLGQKQAAAEEAGADSRPIIPTPPPPRPQTAGGGETSSATVSIPRPHTSMAQPIDI